MTTDSKENIPNMPLPSSDSASVCIQQSPPVLPIQKDATIITTTVTMDSSSSSSSLLNDVVEGKSDIHSSTTTNLTSISIGTKKKRHNSEIESDAAAVATTTTITDVGTTAANGGGNDTTVQLLDNNNDQKDDTGTSNDPNTTTTDDDNVDTTMMMMMVDTDDSTKNNKSQEHHVHNINNNNNDYDDDDNTLPVSMSQNETLKESHDINTSSTTGGTIPSLSEKEKEPPRETTISTITTTTTPIIDLQRPVKRARSAYFLFLDDYRSAIQKENPGASVATVARILGQQWSAMSESDKQPYHNRAIIERERVIVATEAWKKAAIAAGKNLNVNNETDAQKADGNANHTAASMVLPVGRVRKICRLDPDVRGISKEALLLITKVTEMVTVQMGQECIKTAHIQNRRTLLPQDLVDVCNIRESFFFLKDDITDLHRQQQLYKQQHPKTKSSVSKSGAHVQPQVQRESGGTVSQQRKSNGTTTTVPSTSKPLTDYFKPVA